VVDTLRSSADRVWADLSPTEQSRLVRHAVRRWEVLRHRMAPAPAAAISAMVSAGDLEIRAGRLASVDRAPGGFEAHYVNDRRPGALRVAAIVNCTGPGAGVGGSTDPFVDRLLAGGIARPSALGLGLDTEADGSLPGLTGRVAVVGPLRKGRLWETTAIPEIRAQAAALGASWWRAADLGRQPELVP
jgi:uncharacterized NAD(P)/FAD-binding protein YdhS